MRLSNEATKLLAGGMQAAAAAQKGTVAGINKPVIRRGGAVRSTCIEA